MRRNDPFDDPFDEIVREVERMMNEMMDDVTRDRALDAGRASESSTTGDAHIDVQETDSHLRVVADIPGVDEEDITLQCDGRVLRIEAAGNRREYDEHVRLPTRVAPRTADATYNNGILEVVFERADDTTDIELT